ncbi:prepilin peptidase CpaA [Sulfitobacter brevis]|uniref:Prepilin peptidase CpaA n=1 Tax=Sulfitobacter brevis TaxID=74348 RepID=A0A1I1XUL1_9RHOB|nr:prepilin peptidase [Sulfitobacter brevis]SFE10992.1 prepilin peptidase CpaA [Sulfitobacter brevis]
MNGPVDLQLPVSWIIAPLLVCVILYDMRFMRIPNRLVLVILVVAVGSLAFSVSLEQIVWRAAAAAVVFVFGLTLFALRLMGGGDVKLLAVLTLLIPTDALAVFALVLSVGIVAGVVLLMVLRAALKNRETGWRGIEDHSRFPLGLSIGLSGLAFLALAPSLT